LPDTVAAKSLAGSEHRQGWGQVWPPSQSSKSKGFAAAARFMARGHMVPFAIWYKADIPDCAKSFPSQWFDTHFELRRPESRQVRACSGPCWPKDLRQVSSDCRLCRRGRCLNIEPWNTALSPELAALRKTTFSGAGAAVRNCGFLVRIRFQVAGCTVCRSRSYLACCDSLARGAEPFDMN